MKVKNKDNNKTGQYKESKKDENNDSIIAEDEICKRIEKFLEDADTGDNEEKIVIENFID